MRGGGSLPLTVVGSSRWSIMRHDNSGVPPNARAKCAQLPDPPRVRQSLFSVSRILSPSGLYKYFPSAHLPQNQSEFCRTTGTQCEMRRKLFLLSRIYRKDL